MFFSDRLNKEKMVIDEKDLISVKKCGVCGSSQIRTLFKSAGNTSGKMCGMRCSYI